MSALDRLAEEIARIVDRTPRLRVYMSRKTDDAIYEEAKKNPYLIPADAPEMPFGSHLVTVYGRPVFIDENLPDDVIELRSPSFGTVKVVHL